MHPEMICQLSERWWSLGSAVEGVVRAHRQLLPLGQSVQALGRERLE
jgi:hypothetical protein